jgi:hypothetical protein
MQQGQTRLSVAQSTGTVNMLWRRELRTLQTQRATPRSLNPSYLSIYLSIHLYIHSWGVIVIIIGPKAIQSKMGGKIDKTNAESKSMGRIYAAVPMEAVKPRRNGNKLGDGEENQTYRRAEEGAEERLSLNRRG